MPGDQSSPNMTTPLRAACASTRWCGCAGSRCSARPSAVLVVNFGLDFELPIWSCLAVIALSAGSTSPCACASAATQRLEPRIVRAWLLAFDIAELAVLLFLTGGLQNPFAFLFLGPVLVSATALPPRMTLMLGALASRARRVLLFFHLSAALATTRPFELPCDLHRRRLARDPAGVGFIGVYAWQIAEGGAPARRRAGRDRAGAGPRAASVRSSTGSRRPRRTSSARRSRPSRSSPRSSSAAIEPDSPHAEDIQLLREQAQRCRDILGKLT